MDAGRVDVTDLLAMSDERDVSAYVVAVTIIDYYS